MTNNDIVQKLWNLCNVLRDDGINYSDYVTEIVLLLFIKMVHENTEAGLLGKYTLPEGCRWENLSTDSASVLNDYKCILVTLATGRDRTGKEVCKNSVIREIYADAQTRLREPGHLKQIIKTFDSIDWFSAQRDGLGDLYEGLLEKNASESKSGAGQYFTSRSLINVMVRCIAPQAGEIIQDPAAGTAGFLIAADTYIKSQTNNLASLSNKEQEFQRKKAFVGGELVPSTRRLALMNCLLHGIDGDATVRLGNTLGQLGLDLPKSDVVLANPPFGAAKGGDVSITRTDLPYRTTNKQLMFLQHIYNTLKPGGRAAVIFPDNVLFDSGVGTEIRRELMDRCNLHTILRLPSGIFYAHGVKTNVLFFTRGTIDKPRQIKNCTKSVWVYDLRANMPNLGKRTPFSELHLKAFEDCYAEQERVDQGEKGRWRCFSRNYIRDVKGDSLDISWLKDETGMDTDSLPEPDVLAVELMSELVEAMRELDGLLTALGKTDEAKAQKAMLLEILEAEKNE